MASLFARCQSYREPWFSLKETLESLTVRGEEAVPERLIQAAKVAWNEIGGQVLERLTLWSIELTDGIQVISLLTVYRFTVAII